MCRIEWNVLWIFNSCLCISLTLFFCCCHVTVHYVNMMCFQTSKSDILGYSFLFYFWICEWYWKFLKQIWYEWNCLMRNIEILIFVSILWKMNQRQFLINFSYIFVNGLSMKYCNLKSFCMKAFKIIHFCSINYYFIP